PYWVFVAIAILCGFGGANFSSSMSNISFFYPKQKQGLALTASASAQERTPPAPHCMDAVGVQEVEQASSRSAGAVRMMPQTRSLYSGAIRDVLQSIHFSAWARSI
ncbi:hypothetical protein ABGA94_05030, partial [Stenotrophomonas sp. 3diitr2024]